MKNINPKLNLDELLQIDKPEGKQNTHTHTICRCLCEGRKHPFKEQRINPNLVPLVKCDPKLRNSSLFNLEASLYLTIAEHTNTEHIHTRADDRPLQLRVQFSNQTRAVLFRSCVGLFSNVTWRKYLSFHSLIQSCVSMRHWNHLWWIGSLPP